MADATVYELGSALLIDVSHPEVRWILTPTRDGAARRYVSTAALVADAKARRSYAPFLSVAARMAQEIDRRIYRPTLPVTWGSGREDDRG